MMIKVLKARHFLVEKNSFLSTKNSCDCLKPSVTSFGYGLIVSRELGTDRMNAVHISVITAAALLAFTQTYSIADDNVPKIDDSLIETPNDEEYRLPTTLSPETYTVTLTPFIEEGNFTFNGFVGIVINVVESTNLIALHAKNLNISSIEVTLSNSSTVAIVYQAFNEVTDILTLTLGSALAANSTVNLRIRYIGILRDDVTGFYRISYTDAQGNLKWIAATMFSETHARQVFPCFDEPAFKARFNIIINRAQELYAISNMPIIYSSEPSDGRITDVFAETPMISTYLLAIIVSDVESLTTLNGNFSVWARPNAIYQGEYALNLGPTLLTYYTEVTDHDYPLPKMDMVALPDFIWNAMENWGLIIYWEEYMLYDKNHSSAVAKQRAATIVAHELSLQWFSNIVTLKWWDHLWLNEGFAKRFEYVATDVVETSWNMRYQFLVEAHQVVFADDALESAHALSSAVLTPAEIRAHFSTITFSKGASILRMIENILGESVWHAVLRDYIGANLYRNVEPDDLWSAIQGQVDINGINLGEQIAKTVFDTWVFQAGFPVVCVDLERSTGIAEISQERFLLRGTEDSVTNLTWWVPISFITESNPDFNDTSIKHWLSKEIETVQVNNGSEDWVIFNVQETGYYRVNYDAESWTKIIDLLNSEDFETIHVLNRAQIIDDLLNLARTDYVSYKTALAATQYLKRERNYIPWKALFNGLIYLGRRVRGQDDIDALFKTHVLTLIDNIYNILGFDDMPGEDWLDVLNRIILQDWACYYDQRDCISKSVEYFAAFKANTSNTISPNRRATVYCGAIKNGTSDEWYFLWNQYTLENEAAERSLILQALGCSRNYTILYDYLHYMIEEERGIKPQDISNVYAYVCSYGGEVGVEATLDFIADHYADIEAYYGSLDYVSSILSAASVRLSTDTLLNKFSTLIDTYADDLAPIMSSLSSQLTEARYELNWYAEHADAILGWLSEQYETTVVEN